MIVVNDEKLKDSTVIWKFLSIERLVELLANHTLYFSQTSLQPDDSEGFAPFKQIKDEEDGMFEDDDLYDELSKVIAFVTENRLLLETTMIGIEEAIKRASSTKGIGKTFLRLISDQIGCKLYEKMIEKWDENPFGGYTEASIDAILDHLEEMQNTCLRSGFTPEERKKLYNDLHECSYLCCWNKSNTINDLLWSSYAKGNYGIAIESTIGSLKATVGANKERLGDFHLNLGRVLYNDKPNYLKDEMDIIEISAWDLEDPSREKLKFFFEALLYKKRKFSAEKEIRLIAIDKNCERRTEKNIFMDFDLSLIKAIHICPYLKKSRAEKYKDTLCKLFKMSFGKSFDEKIIVID